MSRTRPAELESVRYRYISTREAGQRIGVSATTVVELIKKGELKARNVGVNPVKRPEYRVDPASVEAFILRRTVGEPSGDSAA